MTDGYYFMCLVCWRLVRYTDLMGVSIFKGHRACERIIFSPWKPLFQDANDLYQNSSLPIWDFVVELPIVTGVSEERVAFLFSFLPKRQYNFYPLTRHAIPEERIPSDSAATNPTDTSSFSENLNVHQPRGDNLNNCFISGWNFGVTVAILLSTDITIFRKLYVCKLITYVFVKLFSRL